MGGIGNKFGRLHGSRIHTNFVGPCIQKALDILGGTNATTHGKRNKNLVGYRLNHRKDEVAVIRRSGYIEKSDFVSAIKIISSGNLYGVARITQLDKVGPFHHSPRVDI